MTGTGTRLADRYVLQDRVGGGSMGEVWRATDEVLGRSVAVKLMRAELVSQPGFPERFLTEARIMATIRHPGVVAVHDYHGDAERAFLVMEYVDGESLSRRLHRVGPLGPDLTMRLLAQAADALHAAHERGVVHRDIKPGNLLVTADDTVVLTDFGIARSAATPSLTATGAVLGTPSYLSPEQVRGEPATHLSDVYALGVVAYECLTGRRLFEGDNPFEVAMKRLREPCPTLPPDVPAPVAAVIERALAADLRQRWRSAADLATAARQVLAGPAEATVAGTVAIGATEAGPARSSPLAPPTASAPPPETAPPTAGHLPASAHPSTPAYAAGRASALYPPTRVDHSLLPSVDQPPLLPAGYRPPAGPPPPVPPPTPTRPQLVLVANLLLALAAVVTLVYSAGSLLTVSRVAQLAEAQHPELYQEWGGTLVVSSVASIAVVAMLALVLLVLAGFSQQGRRAARTWTYLVAIPLLCCCGPCWGGTSIEPSLGSEPVHELDRLLVTAVPGWYPLLAGRSLAVVALSLLVAMVLLLLPPANRFFAPRPIVYYYPYYPPHQTHR